MGREYGATVVWSGDKESPPRGRDLTLSFLYFAGLLGGFDETLLPGSFRALERDLGLDPSKLAALVLCQGLMQAASGPFWGCLADHGVPRKWILSAGCAAWGGLTLLLAFASSYWVIIVLRLLNGVALGMMCPVAQSLIADLAPKAERGVLFGFQEAARSLGCLLGAVLCTTFSMWSLWGHQGWRVIFASVAAMSLAISPFVLHLMPEQPRPWRLGEASIFSELASLSSYFQIPTFNCIVVQGIFGCVPWQALSFFAMYFQYLGMSDFEAGLLVGTFQLAQVPGSILGGEVGDRLARWSPYHGRPLTAQICVLSSTTLIYIAFKTVPQVADSKNLYTVLMVALGLCASWCHPGVNAPILSEIVRPCRRALIMAWLNAISNGFAAVIGAPTVALVAERIYGYVPSDADIEEIPPEQRDMNARALGTAMLWCTVAPWLACFSFYSVLHRTYPADARMVEMADEAIVLESSRSV